MNYLKILLAAAALWYFFNPPMSSYERYKSHFMSFGKQSEWGFLKADSRIMHLFRRFCLFNTDYNLPYYGGIFTTNKKSSFYKLVISNCPNSECVSFTLAEYKKHVDNLLLEHSKIDKYEAKSKARFCEWVDYQSFLSDTLIKHSDLDYEKIIATQQISAMNTYLIGFFYDGASCMNRSIFYENEFDITFIGYAYTDGWKHYCILGDTVKQEIALRGDHDLKLKYFNQIKSVKISNQEYPIRSYFHYETHPKRVGKHAYTVEFVIDTTYGIREDTVRRTFYYYVYKQPVELVTKATFTAKTGARLQLKNGFTGGEIALDSLTQNADIQYFFPQVDSFATPKNLVIEYPDLDNNLQRTTSTDGKIPASVLAILSQRKRVSAVNIFSQRSSLALILKP